MPENNNQEKQHTPEFEDCIQKVIKQGHDKGSAMAICTSTFKKAGKPLYVGESENQKLYLFSESIKIKEGNRVSGVCIHPKRIFHPEEGLTHVYLKEELEKAAPTLIGKPFGIDHTYPLPPPNVITNAWYDLAENGVAYEGTVDETVAEQINRKEFKGVSIELNWLKPGGKVEYMNGVAPRNFELTSVHLLKRFPPGDKDAYIKFWNAIMEQMPVGPAQTLDQKVDVLLQRFESFTGWVNERFAKIEGTLAGLAARPGLAESAGESEEVKMLKAKVTETEGKLNDALKKLQEAQQNTKPLQEPAEIVTLRKELVETQSKLADAEKKTKAEKDRFARFHEAVKDALPNRETELRWLGTGPKLFAEKVKRVLHEFQTS